MGGGEAKCTVVEEVFILQLKTKNNSLYNTPLHVKVLHWNSNVSKSTQYYHTHSVLKVSKVTLIAPQTLHSVCYIIIQHIKLDYWGATVGYWLWPVTFIACQPLLLSTSWLPTESIKPSKYRHVLRYYVTYLCENRLPKLQQVEMEPICSMSLYTKVR